MGLLNKLYPLRKCKNIPKKACLYYHLGQCLGPCIEKIDPKVYEKMAAEIRKFLKGDAKDILKKLNEDMLSASMDLNFEKAKEIFADLNARGEEARKYQSLVLRCDQSGKVSGS